MNLGIDNFFGAIFASIYGEKGVFCAHSGDFRGDFQALTGDFRGKMASPDTGKQSAQKTGKREHLSS